MGFVREFKEFAVKGNALDLAIGVIVGAAFGKIVSSLVSDILMPPIGLLLGRVDFNNLYINLSDQRYETFALAKAAGAPTINYGVFMNNVLDFTITAFAIFLCVKLINRLRGNKPSEPSPKT